eukprot:186485_1
MAWQGVYLILFSSIKSISGQSSNFNCHSSNLCNGTNFTCLPGAHCYINCNGYEVCTLSTWNCPDNYDCHVTANGNARAMSDATVNGGYGGNLFLECGGPSSHACYRENINCPTNGYCNLSATTGGSSTFWTANIHAENSTQLNMYSNAVNSAFAKANIYCPISRGTELETNCNIKVEGGASNMLDGTEIHSVKSFTELSLICKYTSNNLTECGIPRMRCTQSYTSECAMLLQSGYDDWICQDTSGLCDNYTLNPSQSPTNIPTTATPSNYPTFIPTLIPTIQPSMTPSKFPTNNPSTIPTFTTSNPTNIPSKFPTNNPSTIPTSMPTNNPSLYPSL